MTINENLSILLILYEENFNTVSKCLENLKDFKVIIIDNGDDKLFATLHRISVVLTMSVLLTNLLWILIV